MCRRPQSSESMFHPAVEASPRSEAVQSKKHFKRFGQLPVARHALTIPLRALLLQAFKVRTRTGAPRRSPSRICRIAGTRGAVRSYRPRGTCSVLTFNYAQKICRIFVQIVAIRGAIIFGGNGSFLGCPELEVRVGPGRVGEGAREEGEAQRRARAQEEDLGKQTGN